MQAKKIILIANGQKKKDIIEKCISTAGITDLSRVVMIGDTEHDAIGARNVGVDFLGVSYGFGFKSLDDIHRTDAVGGTERAIDLLRFF